MKDIIKIVNDYVAVWNEADAAQRRRRIRSVWLPDGTTCFRLLDAHGYDAIEQRVTGSWEKWLSEAKYVFRPKGFAHHHDAIKLEFVMVRLPGGEVEANGLSFLLLDAEGKIRHDYQFNPSANDATELTDRYVTILSEPDSNIRRRRIEELWAPACRFASETASRSGLNDIASEFEQFHGSGGRAFSSANLSQAHHNLAWIKWQMRSADGETIDARTDLLILDDDERIRVDYQFREAA
jgi:hypothetical protein